MSKNNDLVLENKKNDIELSIKRVTGGKGKGAYDFNNAKLVINGITIYNGRIVETKNGDIFYSAPSYKGSDGKYYSYVFIDKDDMELVSDLLNDNKDEVLEYLA